MEIQPDATTTLAYADGRADWDQVPHSQLRNKLRALALAAGWIMIAFGVIQCVITVVYSFSGLLTDRAVGLIVVFNFFSYVLPGIFLLVTASGLRGRGLAAPIVFLFIMLWTTVGVAFATLGSIIGAVHETEVMTILPADLANLILLLALGRMWYLTLNILFVRESVLSHEDIRMVDVLGVSKKLSKPASLPSAKRLLGRWRMMESLLLLIVGAGCFCLTFDWTKRPAASAAAKARPFNSDVYGPQGLPAAERKTAIDALAINSARLSESMLDAILREFGAAIFHNLSRPLTASGVSSAVTGDGPALRIAGGGSILPIYFDELGRDIWEVDLSQSRYAMDQVHVFAFKRVIQEYPPKYTFQRIGAWLNEVNSGGKMSQQQADVMIDKITRFADYEMREERSPAVFMPNTHFDADGTLVTSFPDSKHTIWISPAGQITENSPAQIAAEETAAFDAKRARRMLHISPLIPLLVITAGIFGSIIGLGMLRRTTTPDVAWHPLSYLFASLLNLLAIACLAAALVMAYPALLKAFASSPFLMASAACAVVCSLLFGVAAPIRMRIPAVCYRNPA